MPRQPKSALRPTAQPKDASPVKPGLREKKIQQQRQRLIDVAIGLFCEKGFDSTSIAEIIDGAEISERTFFRYFKTKDELAFVWNDQHGRFVLPMLASWPKHERPLRAMKKMLLLLADQIDGDQATCIKMVRMIFDSPTLEARAYIDVARWENVFVSTLQQGRILTTEENFRLQVEVTVAVNAFVVAVRSWARASVPGKFRTWLEAALAVI